jgi:hypothetical protein
MRYENFRTRLSGLLREVSGHLRTSRARLSTWMVLAAVGMFLGATRPASADYLWKWSYSCSILETQSTCKGGSGTYTSTQVAQGPKGNPYYVLTGIEGTVEGNTITALLPPNSLGNDNDNRISAYGGTSNGAPYSWDPSHKITGIGFLINNDPATAANVNLLYQNFIDGSVGDYTQIISPAFEALLNIDFKAKYEGIVAPTIPPAAAPEPGSLAFMALAGLLVVGCAGRKLLMTERQVKQEG